MATCLECCTVEVSLAETLPIYIEARPALKIPAVCPEVSNESAEDW